MTADNGSSRSQADVHNDVRGDIQVDDARQLANTLNDTLVRWYIDFNHGPQKRYPRICLPVIEAEDLKTFSDALVPFIDRGARVEASQILDKFGIADPEKGAEVLFPKGAQPAPAETPEPALNRSLALALNAEQTEDDNDLLEIRDALLDEWQPVMEEIINPIQTLLEQSQGFEDFREGLVKLVESGELDAGQMISALARGTFISRAMGESD